MPVAFSSERFLVFCSQLTPCIRTAQSLSLSFVLLLSKETKEREREAAGPTGMRIFDLTICDSIEQENLNPLVRATSSSPLLKPPTSQAWFRSVCSLFPLVLLARGLSTFPEPWGFWCKQKKKGHTCTYPLLSTFIPEDTVCLCSPPGIRNTRLQRPPSLNDGL